MGRRRRSWTWKGYRSRCMMTSGCLDNMRSVIIGGYPARSEADIMDAISRKRTHRPFTNRIRDIIGRRMRGLEPLSSDSESEYESETETEEKKLSEATTSTLPSSSMQEQDLQADAPPLKLEDVIPPTQASSSRNKKRRNKKLVSKTTPPPN
ncbi:hypothetical protein N665_0001s0041 [Sinapis alba]|nr:hypothetical protein N665_0001s0041 [Sinapis alba]